MKKIIKNYVQSWEDRCYTDGIPDEVPLRIQQLSKAPSYKEIAIAILKNDHTLKSLGLPQKKSVYYHILKKIEIENRNK